MVDFDTLLTRLTDVTRFLEEARTAQPDATAFEREISANRQLLRRAGWEVAPFADLAESSRRDAALDRWRKS